MGLVSFPVICHLAVDVACLVDTVTAVTGNENHWSKKMKKLLTAFLALTFSQFALADGHAAITVPDESFSLKGKMLNADLTDAGGVITVEGIAGRYGRV
jgi:hypothetical protein